MNIQAWPYNRLKFPNKHVLVCEDDISQQARFAKYIESIFESQGNVICSFVPSAAQAVAILYSVQTDLIILDRDMPWGNGDYVVLVAKEKNIPVITASGLDGNNIQLMNIGATHKFNKEEVINGYATNIIREILGVEKA
jgi:CheY-like chemotaxis protein